MKQHGKSLHQLPIAVFFAAVLIMVAGFVHFNSARPHSGSYSDYRVECRNSSPAVLPGIANGFIAVESSY